MSLLSELFGGKKTNKLPSLKYTPPPPPPPPPPKEDAPKLGYVIPNSKTETA